MGHRQRFRGAAAVFGLAALAACSGNTARTDDPRLWNDSEAAQPGTSRLSDLFNSDNPNTTVEVNKYLWLAALEVLNFLPVESADPFSGIITTGFGTPPGGGQAYRATILINDPALDARSLKLALATRGGPAPQATVRAVEDAILTRARQLRIADSRL